MKTTMIYKLQQLINECLNFFFMIDDKSICNPIVKFMLSLASLLKKVHNYFKR